MKTFAILIMLAVPPAAVSAATITVNTPADNTTARDGLCTLREAIANVNAAADTTGGDCVAGTGTGDTITFTFTTAISLTLGQLSVGQNVTISGPAGNSGSLWINGHGSRVFEIAAGTTTISDLSIHGNEKEFGPPGGGAIAVDAGAGLALTNCMLRANKASAGGGAIFNGGTATLTHCTLIGNRSYWGNGGAILNAGTLSLTDCVLRSNNSGAIYNTGAVTLTNCTLSGNKGTAIFNSGTATLTNCTLRDNRAPKGYGGALLNQGFGTATLTNCTLRGNAATFGGAIFVINGAATLTNCTLSHNKARGGFGGPWTGGGAIGNYGSATLTNCTLSDNKGGAIVNNATATLMNTIVAKSLGNQNCTGTISSNGHNLSSDGTCFTSGGTDLLNTNAALAPLDNYGGPTSTLALCSGVGVPALRCLGTSPAIDAGDDAVMGPPYNLTTDQRGLARQAGLHVDIGAYEAQ